MNKRKIKSAKLHASTVIQLPDLGQVTGTLANTLVNGVNGPSKPCDMTLEDGIVELAFTLPSGAVRRTAVPVTNFIHFTFDETTPVEPQNAKNNKAPAGTK